MIKSMKIKTTVRSRIIVITQGLHRVAAHSIYNARYKTPKEILAVFHNGSNYDQNFIIKKLEEEFEGQFECLGENTEKYKKFSVPIKKETEKGKTTTYKIKFIDSVRFMSMPPSSLVDNISGGLLKCKDCKSDHENVTTKEKTFNCGDSVKIR